MISLMPIKMAPGDMEFTCTDDPDRVVSVRRCDDGAQFAILTTNGPGRKRVIGLHRDSAERLAAALLDALAYEVEAAP